MKKKVLATAMTVFLSGCAAERTAETNAGPTANRPAAENRAVNAPANEAGRTNAAAPSSRSGESIEGPVEINFSDGLPEKWEWIDPEKENPTVDETSAGMLRWRIPSNKDLFGENRTAPRLLKDVAGDFEIETRVRFDPNDAYQGAGLLVFRNDNNYLRLERAFGGVGGGENGVRMDIREDEIYEPLATQEKFATAARVVELKIRRAGPELAGFWREPGGEWKEVGRYKSAYPETIRVGLIGCNTAAEITAEFAYIKLTPAAK